MLFKYLALIFLLISCSQPENSSLVTPGSKASLSKSFGISSLESISGVNESAYPIVGTCAETSSQVQISFNSGELITTTNCASFNFSTSVDVSGLTDSNSLEVVLTEGANTITRNIVKDTVAPTLSSNTFTNGSYTTGNVLTLTVNFNEPVFFSGSPRVELEMENKSQANLFLNYSSGNGTNQIQFTYTIVAGDNDSNGIALAANIDNSLGTLRDSSGNEVSLALTTTAFGSVTVDTNVPAITSIIEPVNGTYADGGGELSFQVNFSEAVNISGTPRLVLNIGGTTRYASYSSGAGSAGLEFKYPIQAGDNDGDGITFGANSIDLNSGSIQAASDSDNAGLDFTSFIDSMASVIVNTSSGITAPAQVTGVTTAPTTSNTALSLAWSTPSDNGTAILNYAVQYRQQGNTTWINTPAATSTTTTVSGLTAGVTYEFRVAANNGLLGPYSTVSNAEIFDVLSLNPIAWLSATNISNGGTEPNNGDKVATWKDLTGTATDATEADTSKQPVYETNVQNGLPAVKFDGTIDRGLEGSFTRTNNGGLTMILVGKFSGTARRAFFEFYKTGGGTSPGSPRGFFFTYGFNNASTNYNLDNTQFNVWSAYDTGSNTDFWENGNVVYTNFNNWGNTSFTGSGSYVLGDDQTGGDRLNGYIGEFLIFDRQLTTQEMNTLQTYLRNKWGTP